MRRIGFSWAVRPVCVVLFAPFLCLQLAWAQASKPPLTLDAAMGLAMQAHPDLRAAKLERDAAQGASQQAGAWLNPELSALMEDTRRDSRTTTLQLNQTIELGGKRAARVNVAQWAQKQAGTDLAARQAQIKAQLTTAFYGLAVAQEQLRLADELAHLAARTREATAKRVAAGKVSPVEEVKAKVAEAQARAVSAGLASDRRAARQQLAMALGDPAVLFDQVDARIGQLPTPATWAQLEARMADAPALSRAQQEIQRRSALSDIERAKGIPDVTLSLGVKRDEQLQRKQPIIGISLVLPLFDRNKGALLEASRREDKARAEQEALTAMLKTQVTEAFEQLNTALAQAQTLRQDVLPGARQALEVATKGYEMGKFNFLDMLDAQRTLFETETQALAATAQAFRADARLLELLGDTPTLKRD